MCLSTESVDIKNLYFARNLSFQNSSRGSINPGIDFCGCGNHSTSEAWLGSRATTSCISGNAFPQARPSPYACQTAPASPHTSILGCTIKLVLKLPSSLLDLVLGLTSVFCGLSAEAVGRWPILEPVRFYGASLEQVWGRWIQRMTRFDGVSVQAWGLVSAFLEAYFQA